MCGPAVGTRATKFFQMTQFRHMTSFTRRSAISHKGLIKFRDQILTSFFPISLARYRSLELCICGGDKYCFGARGVDAYASIQNRNQTLISVLSLLGQQQQFHFAFGQRPFHFPADPLSGFRMPPIGNCQSKCSLLAISQRIPFVRWLVRAAIGRISMFY